VSARRPLSAGQHPPHTFLLTLSYNGTPFSGLARQTNARTVGGELEGALKAIDPKASLIRAVSRTDAGVHARCQRVAFDSFMDLAPRGWAHALNQQLPDEISVVGAARVDPGFDPRGHAISKRYKYVVLESETRDPFLHRRAWRLFYRLNHQLLSAELELCLGRHDFSAFRSAADQRTDTVREILRTTVRSECRDSRLIEIEIQGDRFLHNMVRIIVGTLVDVARGKLAPGAITRALHSRDRGDLGMTAPPDGLYLDWIELDDYGRDAWPERSSD